MKFSSKFINYWKCDHFKICQKFYFFLNFIEAIFFNNFYLLFGYLFIINITCMKTQVFYTKKYVKESGLILCFNMKTEFLIY